MTRMRASRPSRPAPAFTLVELLIVVVMVAVLATLAVPLYSRNVVNAKMSEGMAGCARIRNAARMRIARSGKLPDPCTLATLNVSASDLNGKHFTFDDYTFTRTGAAQYTIRATLPDDTSLYFEIDQDGAQSGTVKIE